MSDNSTNIEVLEKTLPVAPLKIAAMESCQALGKKVNDYIVSFRENTINEVKEFVNIVLQCPYDVDLVSGRYIIDAKSLMGIFSLDLSKPLTVEIYSDNCEDILEKLAKFAK